MSRTLRAFTATVTLLSGLAPMYLPMSASASADLNVATASATSDPASTTADSPPADSPPENTASEITRFDLLKQHLYIKSVNPGYKIDGVAETGEMIELYNDADVSLPLSGASLRYYNSSGTTYTLFEFPENSAAIGKTILLRYEKAPEVEADATYAKTIALAGSLELVYSEPGGEEKIVSSVCWLGGKDCNAKFNSSKPTTLVRQDDNETGGLDGAPDSDAHPVFEHRTDYVPMFSGGLYLPVTESPAEDADDAASAKTAKPQCLDLEFSEILSYYDESEKEQFIEFYNPTDETISLEGCKLKYKNKLYEFSTTNGSSENATGVSEVGGGGFYVYRPTSFKLTKNPNSENEVGLVDVTSDIVATMRYPHGQKKATAYALISGAWQTTYYPTPGAPNMAQEFRTCPLGKVLNEETGNCVKPTTLASVKPCPAGKYRSPETGRCRNADSSDGSDSAKPCKEGYERNPETGRCRKIKANNGADYALVPTTGEDGGKSSFIALGALGAIGVLGAGYTLFQFRREIRYKIKKLTSKFKK